jgi:hypothetical protein
MRCVTKPGAAMSLESQLREHPRVSSLLKSPRDAEAASAAIDFFLAGQRPVNERWYRSETWQHVMRTLRLLSPAAQADWVTVNNESTGSLNTGMRELQVGDIVQIGKNGEDYRFVTFVMGSRQTGWHATFKNQGAIPKGPVDWRLVATVDRGSASLHTTHASDHQPDTPSRKSPVGGWSPERMVALVAATAAALTAVAGAIAALFRLGR